MDIRKDFPILLQKNRGKPLVYLDSAATSLTPSIVSESEIKYYNEFGGSVHRSVYELGEKATNAYENSRKNLAKFIFSSSFVSPPAKGSFAIRTDGIRRVYVSGASR